MKRGAGNQLTKDDFERGSGSEEEDMGQSNDGVAPVAAPEVLKKREFLTVKRKDRQMSPDEEEKKAPAAASSSSSAAPAFPTGTNALTRFLQRPAGSWECAACMLENTADKTKCAACETPKPGTEEAAKSEVNAFSSTGGGDTSGGFSFSFGGNAGTASSNPVQFTFGDGAGVGFSVDQKWESFATVASSSGNEQSAFGANSTEFEKASSLGTASSGTVNEQFKGKEREATGEEDEQTLQKTVGKLYVLVKEDETDESGKVTGQKDTWKESGKGDLHVNTYTSGNKTHGRMVLRAEKTHRLLLNAPVLPGMKFNLQDEKFVKFVSQDLEKNVAVFLLRFASKADAQGVYDAIQQVIDALSK